MSEGWKQIWDDIRHALKPPAAEGETGGQVDSESTIQGVTPLTSPSPAQPAVELPPAKAPPESQVEPGQGIEEPAALAEAAGKGEVEPAEGLEQPAELADDEGDLAKSAPEQRRWLPILLFVGLVAAAAFYFLHGPLTMASPPAPNVVATYDGGQITVEDVRQHLALLVPDEKFQGQLQNVAGYQMLVEQMITDEVVRRWAAERKADRDEKFQHAMKHISENMNLDQVHTQMHEKQVGVTEADIQAYYNANRQQFGDLTLTQARDQILTTLEGQREDQFVQDYLNRLKENASITRDFSLLEVPEPAEPELRAYYEANQAQYLLPAQAVVDEIRIAVGQDEAAAQEQANKALTRLGSGEEFAAVAGDLSQTPFSEQGVRIVKGQRDPAYDDVVFKLEENELSNVFRAGDAFYLVQLRAGEPERQQTLDEVRAQIRQAVLAEKEAAWFKENANRTLFTIHGERYTAGEFWQEYQELPPTFLVNFQGAEGRKALAERLIERLLLVEDSYDQLLETENKAELEEVRLNVLAQMMEQEEVDDKIQITDEEVQQYYEQHKDQLVEPPQVKIRVIVIQLGQAEDERKRAWDKANEAYQKLAPGLLQTGADFAEIARQYSEDEVTANQGGEAGWVREGPDILAELVEHPFHQQILGLAVGEISQPFEWEGVIYIVQVQDRKEGRQLTLEETKDILREELRLKKHDELTVQLSQKLLEQAQVKIYDEVLLSLVKEQGQVEQPAKE